MEENINIEGEIARLSAIIADNPADAQSLCRRGQLYWKIGRRGDAMSDYARAADIDPDGPATTLLEASREIMAFFNKDLYNP